MKKMQAIQFISLVTLFIVSIGGLPLVLGFSKFSFVIQWIASFVFGVYVIFLIDKENKPLLAMAIIGIGIFFVGLPIWLYEIKKGYLPFVWLQKSRWEEFVVLTNTLLFFFGAGMQALWNRQAFKNWRDRRAYIRKLGKPEKRLF